MVVLLTITILTMICATSLYIMSQNANATTQTASWQQSLSGAESAVDQAMSEMNNRALTPGKWTTGWYTVTGTLPSGKPAPTGTLVPAIDFPAAGSYNYYIPPTLAVSPPSSGVRDESSNTLATWVTVDTAGLPPNDPAQIKKQAYRVRATGVVGAPGPARVSNNKLDNQLRKISLRFNRFSGTAVTTPQAARRIEVIATPVTNSKFPRAITMQNWLDMTGSTSLVDSFDSSSTAKSTYGIYDVTKRQSHGDIGLISSVKNNSVSNLNNNDVYGKLQYSGPAVKKTNGVKGGTSTPFRTTLDPALDPVGTFTPYTTDPNNIQTVTASGTTEANPTRYKIDGDFSLQQNFNIFNATTPAPPVQGQPPTPPPDVYIEIWVTGNYNNTGQGVVTQAPGVHATWYVDGNITTAGGAYVNKSNVAADLSFMAVGTGSIKIAGSGNLIGTFYGPLRDVSFTGNGSLMGAVIGNNLTVTSGASIHYDEALGTSGPTTFSNYAYASWFEDNSDPARNMIY